MNTAIDGAGRVVVPKAIRDKLGLRGGTRLEITERDGVIELHPLALEVDLVDTPEGPVAVSRSEVPKLDDATIRETLERVRR